MIEVSPKQQAVELINRAKEILLVTHRNPDGDALGSLLALKIALEKLGKKVSAVCDDEPSRQFAFLPKIDSIKSEIEVSNDLVISLNIEKTEIGRIGYKKDEAAKRVNIVITPREGKYSESDVKIIEPKAHFDLVISVDTPNFERLGTIANPTDIFYETLVVNIDHHPSNERFGKVNWCELVATSTAEILVSLFEALSKDVQLIDADVATCLLTGLIYDTSSFQNVNTTPKSLTVAAQLVAAGGKQQEIVKNLFKTKSLETLKLWGLVLTKVKEDKMHRFLYSSITKQEIEECGADENALSGIVDELLKSATDVDFALLLSERDGQIHGSLRSIAKGMNVAQIAEIFDGGGHEVAAAFRLDGRLKSEEDEILRRIRDFQDKNTDKVISDNVISEPEVLPNVTPGVTTAKVEEEKIEKKEEKKPVDFAAPIQDAPEEKKEVTAPVKEPEIEKKKEDKPADPFAGKIKTKW